MKREPSSLEDLLEQALHLDEEAMASPDDPVVLRSSLEEVLNQAVHIIGVITRRKADDRCALHMRSAAEALIADVAIRLAVLDFGEQGGSKRPAFALEHAENAFAAIEEGGSTLDSDFILKQMLASLVVLAQLPAPDESSRARELMVRCLRRLDATSKENETLVRRGLADLNSALHLESLAKEFELPEDRLIFLQKAEEVLSEADSVFAKIGHWEGAESATVALNRVGRTVTQISDQLAANAPTPTVCSECGGTLGVSARFCGRCGAQVPLPAPASEHGETAPSPPARACPMCGAALRASARFCPGCGSPV